MNGGLSFECFLSLCIKYIKSVKNFGRHFCKLIAPNARRNGTDKLVKILNNFFYSFNVSIYLPSFLLNHSKFLCCIFVATNIFSVDRFKLEFESFSWYTSCVCSRLKKYKFFLSNRKFIQLTFPYVLTVV